MQKKRKMKLLALVMVLMLSVGVFSGCSEKGGETPDTGEGNGTTSGETAAGGEEKVVIGISLGTSKEERWQREIKMFQDYAVEKGVEVVIQSAEDEAQKQMSQAENLISQGVDVLIVQALDSEAAGSIVASAHEADIPVIAYDRLVRNGDLDYYVTFDSVKVGEVQAQFVVEQAPKGNYIWLKGGPEDFNAHLVYEGHKNILQPYIDRGDINIVLEQWCRGWDPKEALMHTENGLTLANNDVQAVIASNDGTAGGAIQALTAQGLAGKVPIAGQDADIAAAQRIVEGTQTGTVYKPLQMLNSAAMEVAIALANGKDPATELDASLGRWIQLDNGTKMVDSFSVDVVAVDKDNIVDVLIKSGFHKLEDVYRNVPQDQWPEVN
ncbi:sugar ABC transporter substrate-binding protein [Anaerotalea alkaliphila]|uniref:Sugar ABC transporter substrate-binding protein n=1 Tax=Anaerotalea alkaliphila TaxID=2662126 RepID=A0A7X5KM28_9FIRM|nr:substrate-binding domain-containing protein [Anaerotalea alkaliphila]NDL67501.1 sugar ABC transporter substrate-binding protein [Anaerotalea alkaliphila]